MRETHWGGIKTSSWFKTWNYYKNKTESSRWSLKHLCTVHQEQNHGIRLTEKSVWRWRPYVNCIIVNKLNLVKLSLACLCLMCHLFCYNLCLYMCWTPHAFKVYLLTIIYCWYCCSREHQGMYISSVILLLPVLRFLTVWEVLLHAVVIVKIFGSLLLLLLSTFSTTE